MKKTIITVVAIAISTLLPIVGSNAMAKPAGFGSIVPNSDITTAFDKDQADSNLSYYYSGSSDNPDVIIGLSASYTLDSTLWQKVPPERLNSLIQGMQELASEESDSLFGFSILDDQGTQIGVWYSPLETPTFVKLEDGKAVDIHTPYAAYRMSAIRDQHH